MCALSLSTTANVGLNQEIAKMRVLLNKKLLLSSTGVSVHSLESNQELSLSVALFLMSEGAASAGKGQGNG